MKSKIVCLTLILGFLYPKVIAQGQTQLPQSAEETVEKVAKVWVWITGTELLFDPEERQKLKRWKPYGLVDQSLLLYDSEGISRISENVFRVWNCILDKKDIETLYKKMMKRPSEPSPEEIARQKEMLEDMRQQMAEGKPLEALMLRQLRLMREPDGTRRRMTEKEYVANFGTEGLEEYRKILQSQEEIRKAIREKKLGLNEINCKERTITFVQSVTYDTEGKLVDYIY